jgi:hypothetical protein
MKPLTCILWLLLAFILSSCNRAAENAAPIVVNGISINVSSFRQAFGSADPELIKTADKVLLSISYGDCPTALSQLGGLERNTSLSVSQKQAIAKLTAEVHQASSGKP